VGALDFLASPLRSLLGEAEHAETEAEHHSPMAQTRELEHKLDDAVAAMHRAADSMNSHVAVVDALAAALPPLTESVHRLTDQLNQVLQMTAPLESAERDISRVEHLFARRHHEEGEHPGPEGPGPVTSPPT
jgi:ABC-type transporter Mla subunit MlaD